MDNLFVFAAHNSVVALIFALFVYGFTHLWRNPPVAHVLWLLVLLKLVAPPVMYVDWLTPRLPRSTPAHDKVIAAAPQIEAQVAASRPRFVDRAPARVTEERSAMSVNEYGFGTIIRLLWIRGRPVFFGFWLGGSGLCALIAATRIVRFERLLRDTLPASERLQHLALEIAGKLGIRRVADVRYAACVEVPLLWYAGRRPTIVLPMRLSGQFDDDSSALILAHELAHLRRRDHWVRAIELIVSTAFWWNPLVWLIRRQIHHFEDLCCDAWVRWAFPDRTKRYAEVLLKTAESLKAPQVGGGLLPASPFLRSLSLKARIEMILESRFAPSVSARSMFAIALLAFLVLPLFIRTSQTEAWARPDDEAPPTPARKPDASTTADFPYAVQFDQGATRFLNGDKITILEIRGTADTFAPGNIYLIRGTYTLASHNRAMVAAFISAMDAKNGRGAYLKVQTTVVKEGDGTFTLYLPMSFRGWPHVSFYPADGGGAFGGNYFGTGDFVLKQWPGSKDTDRKATTATTGSNDEAPAPSARRPDAPTTSEFPYKVRFEQGATRFLNGDKITILEVRGTADTFAPGNTYLIKGTYALASHERATLAAYITAMDAANGTGPSLKVQTTVVNEGAGTFTLRLPMSCRGWPHVSFYPADGGGDFGGNYFGTGDSVLKRWWGSKLTDVP
jgi:beta-lactamase regulating signal transducer with metallopeptidase domain